MRIKKEYFSFALIVAACSFVLLFIGVRFVLGSKVDVQNILAYLVFAGIIGAVATTFIFFRQKQAFFVFIFGVLIGYVEMYRAFISKMNGWGDLVGVLSLFSWSVIGLASGILVQVVYNLYKKKSYKNKKKGNV